MTLTLVTLAIIGSLTLTWFSRGSTATATAPLFCHLPLLYFARPFASLRAWAGCSTSHARLPPPATTFTALSRPPQGRRRVPLRLRNASPTSHDHYAFRRR